MPSNSILRSVLLLALIGSCTNCAFNRLPSSDERSEILAGQRAVILLRVTAEMQDGTPVSAFPTKLMADNINIGLGTFDTGGELKLVESPRFLSTELRKEGWVYLILESGTHYVGIFGPKPYSMHGKYAPRWRIDIPVDTHVVYIGTLHLHCTRVGYDFVGKRCIGVDEHRTVIRNEMVPAQKLAAQYFGDYGSQETLLMQRHDSPTIIFQTPRR